VVHIIAGHPRTGTSMMMAALQAGGMELGYSDSRERLNAKDGAYRPNPGGLYECEVSEVKTVGWPRQYDGKVVKSILQWLGCLSVHEYHVLFMTRDHEEVRQSYEAAFRAKTSSDRIARVEEEAKRSLENRRDVRSITYLRYEDVIADPLGSMEYLVGQGWPIDPTAAAAVVDPEQYRFRIERLTRGV
jgi:hypothetical protein